jgi:hypothetical protein
MPRYGIDPKSQGFRWIEEFVDLLLENPFR